MVAIDSDLNRITDDQSLGLWGTLDVRATRKA